MPKLLVAMLCLPVLLGGCAAPPPDVVEEAAYGKITRLVPAVIESDEPPRPGDVFRKPTQNRPAQRITVLLRNDQLIEITQDEDRSWRVGDTVRIVGVGTKARVVRP